MAPSSDNEEWDGVCACGKAVADGVPCKLGATHRKLRCEEVVDEIPSIEDMLA